MNAIRFDGRARQQASADDDLAHVADFDLRAQITVDLDESTILQGQIGSTVSSDENR
jgi:hypothetical protein